LVVGASLYLLTPPSYVSEVDFYVSTPTSKDGGLSAASQFAQTRVDTYVELASSDYIAKRIIAASGLNMAEADVRGAITATSRLNTVVISTTITAASRETCAALAKGIATVMGPAVSDLDNTGEVKPVQIRVISGPTEPVRSGPGLLFRVGAGVASGLVLGLLFALAKQLFRPRVTEEDEIAGLTGTPLLGRVTLPGAPEKPGAATAVEDFRKVRSALALSDSDSPEHKQVLTVLAATEGGDHAPVAAGIAASLAELGDRVLLVDTDWDRGASPVTGEPHPLADVLSGRKELCDVSGDIGDSPGVWALGALTRDELSLLAPQLLAVFLDRARNNFDRVVLSAPPLEISANATILAPQSDGVILVVRPGTPSPEDLESSVRHVRAAGGTLLGVVVTRSAGPWRRRG
jgi:Mrp family chromosome partitioning ATPase